MLIEGWPDTCDQCSEPIHDYFTFRHKFSLVDGVVLKSSNNIVISKLLRSDALTKLHFFLIEVQEAILRAGNSILWPGLHADIKKLTSNCEECAKHFL